MAANLKALTPFGRWQMASTSSLFSVLDFLSCKSVLHQRNCVQISRHFTPGASSVQHNQSLDSKPIYHRHLHHREAGILNGGYTRLASSQWDTNAQHQYTCPSRVCHLFSQLIITDSMSDMKLYYDCPVSTHLNTEMINPTFHRDKAEIVEPPLEGERNSNNSKEAKEIMRIRHKKMKKHKLKKLRKRMYFLWKKQKTTRRAKRDAIYWKEISDIKKDAKDFDAEVFVKDQLEKARKGGFYIKVL